jgi:phosphoserine phosphatase
LTWTGTEQVGVVADTAKSAALPLCVDLDGTLVRSDTLKDSIRALIWQRPLTAVRLPLWVLRGKAAFKAKVAESVRLDAAKLRYNRPLLEFLREQKAAGRAIYLATAADAKLAEAIAEYVGLFTAVLASDGSTNLAGEKKLAAFRARFPQGFSYIGNALPDLPILAVCAEPMVANPWRSLLRAMRRAGIVPVRSFIDK